MDQARFSYLCCNPFDKANHSSKRKNLRSVLPWMCERIHSIEVGAKICDECRKQLGKLPIPDPTTESSECTPVTESSESVHLEQSDEESDFCRNLEAKSCQDTSTLESVNQCLEEIGETPVVKKKLQQVHYPKDKLKRITTAMKKVIIQDVESSDSGDDGEIIKQLKEKFHTTAERSEKVRVLTVLPKSWSMRRIQAEFGASDYMVRRARELVKQNGILSSPNLKPGHSIAAETCESVCRFYESDEVSRIMPGKKDFVSVRLGEKREHFQKRLLLGNLKELYQLFKDKFPTHTIGFSKFAELRPKHCVLAGASGTHAVCICTIHQNVKLMMLDAKIADLTASDDVPLGTYQHCLARMICNPPQPICYLNRCDACPGINVVKERLTRLMDTNLIDSIVYKQWVSVDRCTLETIIKSADGFVDSFCEKLETLLPHSFIAKQQARFYTQLKEDLQPGEFLITADFSENYSFVLQDAAQGFHWNNSQATIHPFVVYYLDMGKLSHLSYIVISDCLHHDTVAVYLFQKSLLDFLKKKFSIHKVFYYSDGAASQYKNRKNFINLCHHEADFGVPAEWHFSATSHGKGACDGVGGTVKRLAARASLQRPYDQQIMTPRQLFDWSAENVPATFFQYCSLDDYKREAIFLEERFKQARTIPGTRKLHSFTPVSKTIISTKQYSSSCSSKEERVTIRGDELTLEEITGFITCIYDDQWWVACVLQTEANDAVKVSFLHPNGPSRSFRYPHRPDILNIPLSDILTKVDPRTVTGRVYTLTPKESQDASEKLKIAKK